MRRLVTAVVVGMLAAACSAGPSQVDGGKLLTAVEGPEDVLEDLKAEINRLVSLTMAPGDLRKLVTKAVTGAVVDLEFARDDLDRDWGSDGFNAVRDAMQTHFDEWDKRLRSSVEDLTTLVSPGPDITITFARGCDAMRKHVVTPFPALERRVEDICES